jgi:hypothetical protein
MMRTDAGLDAFLQSSIGYGDQLKKDDQVAAILLSFVSAWSA